jgi:hypothetical protein
LFAVAKPVLCGVRSGLALGAGGATGLRPNERTQPRELSVAYSFNAAQVLYLPERSARLNPTRQLLANAWELQEISETRFVQVNLLH